MRAMGSWLQEPPISGVKKEGKLKVYYERDYTVQAASRPTRFLEEVAESTELGGHCKEGAFQCRWPSSKRILKPRHCRFRKLWCRQEIEGVDNRPENNATPSEKAIGAYVAEPAGPRSLDARILSKRLQDEFEAPIHLHESIFDAWLRYFVIRKCRISPESCPSLDSNTMERILWSHTRIG